MNVDLPTFLVPQTKMTAHPSMSPENETFTHCLVFFRVTRAESSVCRTLTSAGADQRVQGVSVALGHAETLDAADQRDHSQTVEGGVENR